MFLFIFCVLCLNITEVNANATQPMTGIRVIVEPSDYNTSGDERAYPGYIDLLINIEDIDSSKINDSVNQTFIDEFPDYLSFAYLERQSDNWVSYRAHYKGMIEDDWNSVEFVDSIVDRISRFQVVHFAENGDVIFVSDVQTIEYNDSTNPFRGDIFYNYDDGTVVNNIGNAGSSYNALWIIAAFFLILVFGPIALVMITTIISIVTEVTVALFFKIKPKLKFVLMVLTINLLTQIIVIRVGDALHFKYYLELIIIEPFVYIIEYFFLSAIFKDYKKQVLKFVVIANTITVIIGVIINILFGL